MQFTKFHKFLFILCGNMWGFGGSTWFTTMQFLIPAVKGRFGIPAGAQGLYPTMFYIGMAFGAIAFGQLSDKRGRRPALVYALSMSATAGFFCAISNSAYVLSTFLLIQGFGVGGVLPIANLLFAEWCPAKVRGKWMMYLGFFFPICAMITSGVSWLVMPWADHNCHLFGWNDWGWRALYIICAIFGGFCTLVSYKLLPESPKFLLVQGKEAEAAELINKKLRLFQMDDLDNAQKSAQKTHREGWSILGDETDSQSNNQSESNESQSHSHETDADAPLQKPKKYNDSIKDLLQDKLCLTSVLLWIIWFSVSFGAQGFNLYLPTLLKSKGIQSSHVFSDVFMYNTAGLPGVYFSALAVETKFGRKWVIFWTLFLTGASMCMFMLTKTEIQLVIFSCLFNMFANGSWCGIYTITPESYPTTIRSQAVSVAHAIHSVAGAVGPAVAGIFVQVDVQLTLSLFIFLVFLAAVSAIFLPNETRNSELKDAL